MGEETDLDHELGLFGVLVGGGVAGDAVLVLAAVVALVDGLARQAVGAPAHRTPEDVDVVVDDAPARTVGRLAVEGVLHALLGQFHRPAQVALVHLGRHQLDSSEEETKEKRNRLQPSATTIDTRID